MNEGSIVVMLGRNQNDKQIFELFLCEVVRLSVTVLEELKVMAAMLFLKLADEPSCGVPWI